MFIYLVILTGCFIKMATYLQWLHFKNDQTFDTLSSTTPGMSVALWLGIGGGLLVVTNVAVFVWQIQREDTANSAESREQQR